MTDETPPPSPYLPPGSELGSPGLTLSADERNWAMSAHLSALTGLFTGFGNIVGPLVVWLIKKDSSTFAAQEAKEALNFQITWMGAVVALGVLSLPLMLVFGLGILTLFIAGLIVLASWILSVVGGVRAGEGKPYRYPFTIRFIK